MIVVGNFDRKQKTYFNSQSQAEGSYA